MTQYTPRNPYIVASEEDAWALLERLLNGEDELTNFRALQFDGWPLLRTYVPQERLHSALTPYMMEGFVDLQRAVFRTHALLAHDHANARILSDEEKSRLELIVEVRDGSSDSSIDFTEIAVQLGTELVNKMDPFHIVVTVLGIALLYAGSSAWKAYLEKAKDEKIAEIQSKPVTEALKALQFAHEADVERMKIMAQAFGASPKLETIAQDATDAKQSLTRHLTKDSEAEINGILIPQEAGQRLTRNTRSNSTDVRLDGVYRINRVDTTSPEGFRVRLQAIEDGSEFDAGVQDALVSEAQRRILQEAEWKKVPVEAQINAKRKGTEIFEAVVIEVREYEPPEPKEAVRARRSI